MGNWVNFVLTRAEGVTNHKKFANIIYRWPLTHAQAIKFDLCPVFSLPTPFSVSFFSTFPPRVEMYKQEVQLQSAEPAHSLPRQRPRSEICQARLTAFWPFPYDPTQGEPPLSSAHIKLSLNLFIPLKIWVQRSSHADHLDSRAFHCFFEQF